MAEEYDAQTQRQTDPPEPREALEEIQEVLEETPKALEEIPEAPEETREGPQEGREEKKKEPRGRRIAKRITQVTAGFLVVSITATEAMMFILFGRTDPVLDRPFAILDWAREQAYTAASLEFMSGGNKLEGYYIVPQDPAALILLVHGVRASSDTLEPVVKYFVENSYAVMTFDGTASGRSEGTKTVGLQQQRYDIQAALDYIRNDPTLAPLTLVLLGHSAGGYGVAVEAERSGAAAAVCVSGFEAPLNTMYFWASRYVGVLTDVEYPFLWLRERAVKGEEANASGSEALCGSGVPSMVIHGSDDSVIARDISLYQALAEKDAPQVRRMLVSDPRFSDHANILISEDGLNYNVLDSILLFLDKQVYRR